MVIHLVHSDCEAKLIHSRVRPEPFLERIGQLEEEAKREERERKKRWRALEDKVPTISEDAGGM